MALLCASTLTACAGSAPSASVGIHLAAVPADVRSCMRPVALPAEPMSRAAVEQLWARDRAALVRCGLNHAAVVAYYDDLAARLDAAEQR
jgi:hypothetical protein